MANSFEEAKSTNAAATSMLREMKQGILQAGAEDPDGGKIFDAAPKRQYGPNAFDKIPGTTRTTSGAY